MDSSPSSSVVCHICISCLNCLTDLDAIWGALVGGPVTLC